MIINNKNYGIGIVLLVLSACDSSSDAHHKLSWSERIKQHVQPMITWFNELTITSSTTSIETKTNIPPDEKLQAQAQSQLMGVMENVTALPSIPATKGAENNENVAQLHTDYDKAVTADDKRDALVSLIEADADNAATLLRDAYADSDPELRKEAVLQMHAFNDQAPVIDLLLRALDDPDSSVVIEAVEGLAQLADKRALAGLKRLAMTHPDEQIRHVAQDYIEQAEPAAPPELVNE